MDDKDPTIVTTPYQGKSSNRPPRCTLAETGPRSHCRPFYHIYRKLQNSLLNEAPNSKSWILQVAVQKLKRREGNWLRFWLIWPIDWWIKVSPSFLCNFSPYFLSFYRLSLCLLMSNFPPSRWIGYLVLVVGGSESFHCSFLCFIAHFFLFLFFYQYYYIFWEFFEWGFSLNCSKIANFGHFE